LRHIRRFFDQCDPAALRLILGLAVFGEITTEGAEEWCTANVPIASPPPLALVPLTPL
jgi:hypothetical protein